MTKKPTAPTDTPSPEQIEAAAKAEAEFNSKLVELIAEGKTDAEAREILGGVAPERRAPDQDAAIETAFVEGALPEVDRRNAEKPSLPDVSLEEPPVEPSTEETKSETVRASLVRVHDILDHLVKQIDPAERIMVHELCQILSDLGLPNRDE